MENDLKFQTHVEMLHFQLVLMNRLNKTKSAVFLYCRFSLFLKDQFFRSTEMVFLNFF